METLRNAAEVLLGYSTTEEQSGKEPGTGSNETGSGGVTPYDPGNVEENTGGTLAPTNTVVEAPTSVSEGVALPGEAAFIGAPPTSTAGDEAPEATSTTEPAPSAASHSTPVVTAPKSVPATTTAASEDLPKPFSEPLILGGANAPKAVEATTTSEAAPSGPPAPSPAAVPTAAPTASSKLDADSTAASSSGLEDEDKDTSTPGKKKKFSTKLKEKLHIK